jgi:uncharacterized protein YodC (DUF2158 family)
MSLNRRSIKASDLIRVASAESFADSREPPLSLGNFVRLNSGGPTLIVVDVVGDSVTVAWQNGSGSISETSFLRACLHRVSPASAGNAAPAA